MTLLSKSAILAAIDLPSVTVEVPEWGGSVAVKALSGAERDAFEATLSTGEGTDRKANLTNLRAKLCVCALVDEAGAPLFSASDIEALGKKSAAALQRCFEAAQKLSGMTPNAKAEAGNDSAASPSAASTSA